MVRIGSLLIAASVVYGIELIAKARAIIFWDASGIGLKKSFQRESMLWGLPRSVVDLRGGVLWKRG
jgi:hypothetical protein